MFGGEKQIDEAIGFRLAPFNDKPDRHSERVCSLRAPGLLLVVLRNNSFHYGRKGFLNSSPIFVVN